MASTKLIKPEFFGKPRLLSFSVDARLLFFGLWSLADENGCLNFELPRDKMLFYIALDADPEPLLVELIEARFIQIYKTETDKFFHICPFSSYVIRA